MKRIAMKVILKTINGETFYIDGTNANMVYEQVLAHKDTKQDQSEEGWRIVPYHAIAYMLVERTLKDNQYTPVDSICGGES